MDWLPARKRFAAVIVLHAWPTWDPTLQTAAHTPSAPLHRAVRVVASASPKFQCKCTRNRSCGKPARFIVSRIILQSFQTSSSQRKPVGSSIIKPKEQSDGGSPERASTTLRACSILPRIACSY